MPNSEVTLEEFREWKNHPVTQQFFQMIREERDQLAERVLNGHFMGEGLDQDRAILSVQVYDSILNVEYEDNDHE